MTFQVVDQVFHDPYEAVISRVYSLLRTFSSSSAFVNLLILKVNIRQYTVDKILIYML